MTTRQVSTGHFTSPVSLLTTTLRTVAVRKPSLTDKDLVSVLQGRRQLLCCTPFAHVWLASQLAQNSLALGLAAVWGASLSGSD